MKFIGVGEQIDDMERFDAEMFVDAILGQDENETAQIGAEV